MKPISINTRDIMNGVWEIVDVLVTIIKSVLIVGGSISASLADVVLGSLTLSLLFVNTVGNVQGIEFAPILVSLGASGIQLILWQMLQNGGGFSKVWKSKNYWLIGAFALVLLMKFGDDFMDITIVIYLMQGSTLLGVLGEELFYALGGTVLFIVWVLTGFSEVFVVNAIEMMKGQKQERTFHQKPNQYANSKNQPPVRLHDDTLNQLLKNKRREN